jgi:hypothetical protein
LRPLLRPVRPERHSLLTHVLDFVKKGISSFNSFSIFEGAIFFCVSCLQAALPKKKTPRTALLLSKIQWDEKGGERPVLPI